MNITEKSAYLKGLMEGLELDDSKKEVKIIRAMFEIIEELSEFITEIDEDVDQIYEEIDAIDEDLSELEEAVFDDEDDCGCDCGDDCDCFGDGGVYEITCPACSEVVCVDEDLLLSEDISCPACGEKFEIEFDEDDEVPEA